ncbi:MAG: hypothetical protein LUE92_07205 [Clostridiales bacterium]|nr:hypothetical protein [Clostridiales bacterium]
MFSVLTSEEKGTLLGLLEKFNHGWEVPHSEDCNDGDQRGHSGYGRHHGSGDGRGSME